MDGIQVALLIVGAGMFVVSFLIPGRRDKKAYSEDAFGVTEDQIKAMVEKEIEDTKQNIHEVVDETISYAMEKAERFMERITNEKMQAIHEYSDTVLEQINKNQQEVVFIYDMLNDKYETLKNTVSQAAVTASEVQQILKDAEVTAKEAQETARAIRERLKEEEREREESFMPLRPEKLENISVKEFTMENPGELHEDTFEDSFPKNPTEDSINKNYEEPVSSGDTVMNSQPDLAMDTDSPIDDSTEKKNKNAGIIKAEEGASANGNLTNMGRPVKGDRMARRNNNENILELHKLGKSNIAIARDLGLGIGEVSLVIDLFEGAN